MLAALLLNRLVLEPGEAIFLPAGNLHAYLHGTGVEMLANSDNVLRGGLTPKHVDVPELLRVLDFTLRRHAGADRRGDRAAAACTGPRRRSSSCPASSGTGGRRRPRAEVKLEGAVPRILVCVDGGVRAAAVDGQELTLARGQSMWLPAADPDVVLAPVGDGRVRLFAATVAVPRTTEPGVSSL